MAPSSAVVANQVHAAAVHSSNADLDVRSGGHLVLAVNGGIGGNGGSGGSALAVSVQDATTRIASDSQLAVYTSESHTRGRDLRVGSSGGGGNGGGGGAMTVRAGSLGGAPDDSRASIMRWTRDEVHASVRNSVGMGVDVSTTGTGVNLAAEANDGGYASLHLSVDGSAGSAKSAESAGTASYRTSGHAFDVAGKRVLSIGADAFVVHTDLAVEGVLTSITGVASDLRVADAVIQVGTDLDTESDAGSAACGVIIDTVPTNAAYMATFEDRDGLQLFVRRGTDVIDVDRAVSSGAFAKRFGHHAGAGARSAGRSDRASRTDEPFWDASGGALRITKYAPDPQRAGHVVRYVITLRVTDDGTLEVGRFKRTLRHVRRGTNSVANTSMFEQIGADEFCPLMACEP